VRCHRPILIRAEPQVEQVFPAQRRPLLARGHLLDFCYAVLYALLVIPLVVLLGSGFSDLLARLAPWLVLPSCPGFPAGASSRSRCSASTRWTG
jgi:hypothetical protein